MKYNCGRWHYLTFTDEAEHNGEAARARTEIYTKCMRQASKHIKSITLTPDEVIELFRRIILYESGQTLDRWL